MCDGGLSGVATGGRATARRAAATITSALCSHYRRALIAVLTSSRACSLVALQQAACASLLRRLVALPRCFSISTCPIRPTRRKRNRWRSWPFSVSRRRCKRDATRDRARAGRATLTLLRSAVCSCCFSQLAMMASCGLEPSRRNSRRRMSVHGRRQCKRNRRLQARRTHLMRLCLIRSERR